MKKRISSNDLSNNRRRKKSRKLTLFIFAGGLFFVGILGLARADAFRIKDVVVKGVGEGTAESMKEIAKEAITGNKLLVLPNNGILFYPKSQLASAIKGTFPELQSVNMTAGINGTLYIEATEKKENYVWCSGPVCYSVDASGVIFERRMEVPEGLIFRGSLGGETIGEKLAEPELLAALSSFGDKMSVLGFEISEILFKNSVYVEATTLDGLTIKLNPENIGDASLLENLKVFISDLKSKNSNSLPPLQYIDIRYGNKIFYK